MKIAYEINESRDDWRESRKWPYLNTKPYVPPQFKANGKPKRRRLNGQEL